MESCSVDQSDKLLIDSVMGEDLRRGSFYHIARSRPGVDNFEDVWYCTGCCLVNPRNKHRSHIIVKTWAYIPLVGSEVEAFTEWMNLNGDIEGKRAWNKCKGEICKEACMADMNDVDLYDKKFVHFEWDESLMGKKGFYNDDMGCLKKEIRNEGARMMGTLIDYCDDSTPFIVQSSNNCPPSSWKFFYYDPNYEVKWAYFREGKPIQWKCKNNGMDWCDSNMGHDTSYFDDNCEYRIKSETPTPAAETKVEVKVDVNVNDTNKGIKIIINGKEYIFENAEQARLVLKED